MRPLMPGERRLVEPIEDLLLPGDSRLVDERRPSARKPFPDDPSASRLGIRAGSAAGLGQPAEKSRGNRSKRAKAPGAQAGGYTPSFPIRLTILGEPASKANSRRMVKIGGQVRFIKSAKALGYGDTLMWQVRKLPELLTGPLRVTLRIWYRTERPDLDESLILDGLQGLIYVNDRQVREKHIYHGIDRDNPRTEVEIDAMRKGKE